MADEPGSGEGDGTEAPRARPTLTREQLLANDRAAFMSDDEFVAGEGNAASKADKKAAKPKKPEADDSDLDDDQEVDEDDDADVDEDAETATADDADDDLDDDDGDLDEDEDAEKPDAETAKRMDKVRRTEQRARERQQQLEADWTKKQEAAVAKFEAEWKPRVEKAEKTEKEMASLRARVKHDAAGVLRDLGLSEDDMEFAAHDVYANSKKGAEDPKRREAVARSKREREQAEEIAELKRKVDEREANEKKSASEKAARAEVERYLDGAAKAATDKTPLAKKYLAASPERARAKIEKLASEILTQTGKVPTAKEAIVALEKDRRRALRELGIDPKTLTPAQAAVAAAGGSKAEIKAAGKKAGANGAKHEEETNGKKLSFLEQKKADRQAFIDGDDN